MRVVLAGLFSKVIFETNLHSFATHMPYKLIEELGLKAGNKLYGYRLKNRYYIMLRKPEDDSVNVDVMTLTSLGKVRYYPKNHNEYMEIVNCNPTAAFYRCFDGDELVGVAIKLLYLKEVCAFCSSENGLCAYGGKFICVNCLIIAERRKSECPNRIRSLKL